MSKRTRYADNSKRQQPIQQQRAQARLPTNQVASRSESSGSGAGDTRSNRETSRRGKDGG